MPSFDLTLEPAFTPTLNLQGEGGTLVLELATILRGEPGPSYPSEAAQAATEAARDAALAAQGGAETAQAASEAARDAAAASAAAASGSAGTASAAAGSASSSAGTASAAAGTATTKAAEASASAGTAATKAAEATAAAAAASGAVSAALSAHTSAADPHPGYALESTIGQPNGLAPLDAGGKVAAGYLPSYVDDVIEAANFAALPATGETGKIYVTLDDNKTWRWGGSAYVEVSAGGATAAAVPFTPAGNLASTNVQAALQELDSEKLNLTGGTLNGLLTIAAGVITSLAPALSISQTWNNAAVPFTGILANFSDTASASGSLLMDLQVGGVSKISADKGGQLFAKKISLYPSHYFYEVGGAVNYLAGRDVLRLSFSSVEVQNANLSLYDGTGRVYLQASGNNVLEQRNGTKAQAFRLYNNYADPSNYGRGFMRWASNVLEIGAEAAGTGTARGVKIRSNSGELWLDDGNSLIYMTSGALFLGARALSEITNVALGGFIEVSESSTPSTPLGYNVRIYAEDNGAGKTRLMARFATGAAVQIAIEP